MKPLTAKEKADLFTAIPEKEKRKARCCFTGQRAENVTRPVDDVKVALENEIIQAINDGYKTFITGMAAETDIWAGCTVLRLKSRFPEIKLIVAVPYPGFRKQLPTVLHKNYDRILSEADLVKTISPVYDESTYQSRNEWMIDHSSRIIAVNDGKPGCVTRYAKEKEVDVRCVRM